MTRYTFTKSLFFIMFTSLSLNAQEPLGVTAWYTHSEEFVDLYHRQANSKIIVEDGFQTVAGNSETFIYDLNIKSQSIDQYIGQEDTLFTFFDVRPYGSLIINENGWSFKEPESEIVKFLYHFNYEIGDSILIRESNETYLTVESIDSIIFNNEYKLRWKMSDLPLYLIEDIGWNLGVKNSDVWKFIQLTQTQFLTCFESTSDQYSLDLQPWVNVFPDIDISWSGCEQVLSSTSELALKPANIHFHPNPTDCEVTIASNKMLDRIELFNVIGKKLATFHNQSSGDQIDLSNYHSGQYILISYHNGEKSFNKVMVK